MKWRTGGLVAAIAIALPAAAQADCAARIAALEDGQALPGAGETAGSAGRVVREDGGKTTHQEGGPALPPDSWFTDSESEDEATALTHLDTARKARAAGDERACLDAVGQAEAVLRKD